MRVTSFLEFFYRDNKFYHHIFVHVVMYMLIVYLFMPSNILPEFDSGRLFWVSKLDETPSSVIIGRCILFPDGCSKKLVDN